MTENNASSKISFTQIISESWKALRQKRVFFLILFAVIMFFTAKDFIDLGLGLLIERFIGTSIFANDHISTVDIGMFIFSRLLVILLSTPILIGGILVALQYFRAQRPTCRDIFKSYKYFINLSIVITLVFTVALLDIVFFLRLIHSWISLIFLLIGIYLYFSVMFTKMLIIDQGMRPWTALKYSRTLVAKNGRVVIATSLFMILFLVFSFSPLLFMFFWPHKWMWFLPTLFQLIKFPIMLFDIIFNIIIFANLYNKVIARHDEQISYARYLDKKRDEILHLGNLTPCDESISLP